MGSVLATISDKDLRKLGRQAILAGWAPERLTNGHVRFQSPDDPNWYAVIPSTPSDWRTLDNAKADFMRHGGLTPKPKERVKVEVEHFDKMVRSAPVEEATTPEPEPPKAETWEKYQKGTARERVLSFLQDRPGRRVDHDLLTRATKLSSPRASQAMTQAMKRDSKVKRIARGVYEYQVEPLPANHDHGRRAAVATKVKRQTRRAKAPKPGEAKTIDQVLQRSLVGGEKFNTPRRQILEVLVSQGGEIKNRNGKATTVLAELVGRQKNARSLTALLAGMEKDQQIGRDVNGKRTLRIYILDPLLLQPETEDEPEPEPELEPAAADDAFVDPALEALILSAHPRGRVQPVVPVSPYVGQQLTVIAAFTGFNGEVTLELKNGTKSWLCNLNAMRLLEEV